MKLITLKIAASVLTIFALLTLFMSGSIIFDLFDIREKEGDYVLFIVITNFICGFLYLISAYGLFSRKKWATYLLLIISGFLLVSFGALLWYIRAGGIYEKQTVKAMLFRIAITILFAILSWRHTSRRIENQ